MTDTRIIESCLSYHLIKCPYRFFYSIFTYIFVIHINEKQGLSLEKKKIDVLEKEKREIKLFVSSIIQETNTIKYKIKIIIINFAHSTKKPIHINFTCTPSTAQR